MSCHFGSYGIDSSKLVDVRTEEGHLVTEKGSMIWYISGCTVLGIFTESWGKSSIEFVFSVCRPYYRALVDTFLSACLAYKLLLGKRFLLTHFSSSSHFLIDVQLWIPWAIHLVLTNVHDG